MCGIAGYFGNEKLSSKIILSTLDLMKTRGPDFSDSYTHNNGKKSVNLLHSRLSIIDLKKRSHQPYILGNFIIIFNGEIYNFKELRKKLVNENINFTTSSDTEVLLKYFIKYGEKCLNFFEGMWSFAIYNKVNGELFLARDRFGEKPLFYYNEGGNFYFGSEIKYIKSLTQKKFDINKNKINIFLANGYKSLCKNNDTFFKKIFSLNSGEFIWFKNKECIKKKYWKLKSKEDPKISETEAIEESGRLLQNSIKLRTRSDVPLSICLSGGVDSSVIASYCVKNLNLKIKTFSLIDGDERYNEKKNIKIVLDDLKCANTIIKTEKKDTLKRLSELVKYHDSPVASIAQYLHSMLMEEVKKDGYKVNMSGTAADEMYSGYYDHFLQNLNTIKIDKNLYSNELKSWKKFILPNVRNKFFRNHNLYNKDVNFREHIYDRYNERNKLLVNPVISSFKENKYSENLHNNRKLNELFHETTPIILFNEDHNAMKYSIENRSPFLDKNLVEFIFSVKPHFNIKNGLSKNLLRSSSKKFVKNKVLFDRKKKGFNSSIESLIDFKDDKLIKNLFDDEKLKEFVDTKNIFKILGDKKNSNYISKFIFDIINIKFFLKHNY